MKISNILLVSLTIASWHLLGEPNKYQQDLKKLPNSKSKKGFLVATKDMMPALFGYLEELCTKNKMKLPRVWIFDEKEGIYLGAVAIGSGILCISPIAIKETSAEEFEAAIAHEIGHIKHSHSAKTFLLKFASILCCFKLAKYSTPTKMKQLIASYIFGSLIAQWIINKSYEKEADYFAFEHGKARGLAQFFKSYLARCEQKKNKTKKKIDDAIEKAQSPGEFIDAYRHKATHVLNSTIKKIENWFYHNTFIGDHPPIEERIQTAQEYIAQHP